MYVSYAFQYGEKYFHAVMHNAKLRLLILKGVQWSSPFQFNICMLHGMGRMHTAQQVKSKGKVVNDLICLNHLVHIAKQHSKYKR